jgi:hypothetical protein
VLEPFEQLDDVDGYAEKSLPKKNPEYYKAREVNVGFESIVIWILKFVTVDCKSASSIGCVSYICCVINHINIASRLGLGLHHLGVLNMNMELAGNSFMNCTNKRKRL